MALAGLGFTDAQFELRLPRFDMPTVRSLIAPSPDGGGCVFLSMRGDGKVSATEITIDGRTPREAPLLAASNPGTYTAARSATRAWVILDDALYTLSLQTLHWDGMLEIPRGLPKARLVAAGEDSVLLCPATSQVRGMARASRGPDGQLAISAPFEAARPSMVLAGAFEQWIDGDRGRWDVREPSDALGAIVHSRAIPRMLEPCSNGTMVYALAADPHGATTTELVAIGHAVTTAPRRICTICGIDGNGRLVATTEGGRKTRFPPGDNPSGIELIDPVSLSVVGRHPIGASNLGRVFGLCLPGAVVILMENKLRIVAWDSPVATPRMARATVGAT